MSVLCASSGERKRWDRPLAPLRINNPGTLSFNPLFFCIQLPSSTNNHSPPNLVRRGPLAHHALFTDALYTDWAFLASSWHAIKGPSSVIVETRKDWPNVLSNKQERRPTARYGCRLGFIRRIG